jgi:translation initiation factor IF-2
MNKGKVRIYELSKELELENKEILEICSELSIVAKSHSSTITESQAESIRAAAQTHTSSHIDRLKEHKQAGTKGEQSSMSQSSEANKGQVKPEILAIHKHHRPSPSQSQGEKQSPDSLVLLGPPQPLAKSELPPETSLEMKTPPSRTTSPSQPQEQIEQSVKEAAVTKSEKLPLLHPLGHLSADSQEQEQTLPETTQELRKKTKPKLSLAKGKNQRRSKYKKGDGEESSSKFKLGKNERQKPLEKSFPKQGEREIEPEATKEKPKPKLQKPPQRPKPPELELELEDQEDTSSVVNTEEEDVDQETLLLDKLKRAKQKQKRSVTKGGVKSWDDDEALEEKKKAIKSVAKVKRRSLVIDDEEESFEELTEGNSNGQTTFSLALARPQQTKSAQPQPSELEKQPKKPKPKPEKLETRVEKKEKPDKQKLPEKIVVFQSLTIRELADLLNTPETEIIKQLFFKGMAVNITQTLDLDTARMVAEELGVQVETEEERASAIKTEMLAEADLENLQQRPPVVTIMGHVDHGKTTLLDSIRQTKVAQGEAGGITQHIGAYHVDVEHEGKQQQIVFLDTPGHEAFTAMRARGAKVTDIAVLVVAADDGVQPQTREAISHAKAAQVPIVVAVNKIDKLEANPDRVKQELMELGLVPEDWGGDTVMVPVSALKGENLEGLLDMILLVSEMEELSANPDRLAKGTVIEAHLDRARGPVATLLVQNGTLRVGDIIVAGSVMGKIRAMIDDRGQKVEQATPSFAVEILGLNEIPAAGDEFDVYANEKEAKAIAETRAEAQRTQRLQHALSSRRVSLSSLSAQAQQGELKELNLILKADVQGSGEAILGALKQLPQKEVQIRVLLAGAGEITETDVDLAAASGAVLVGFNTTLAPGARQAAAREGVDIREYNVIYKLLDEIQGAMEGLLEPEEVEESLGVAQVRAVFSVGRGAVAGCYVQSGKVVRNRFIRVLRNGKVLYEGNLDSLRRVKDDVKEVNAGYECGIGVAKFNDWQEGDTIEAYEMVFKRRTLSQ